MTIKRELVPRKLAGSKSLVRPRIALNSKQVVPGVRETAFEDYNLRRSRKMLGEGKPEFAKNALNRDQIRRLLSSKK